MPPAFQICVSDSPFEPVTMFGDKKRTLREGLQTIVAERELWQRHLANRGAILFRGFPVETPADFDEFVETFRWPNFPYRESLSNAVRVNKTDRVFTANEAPADVEIYLHHEMAQTPVFPTKIFFCCTIAADSGGATPICRSDILLNTLLFIHFSSWFLCKVADSFLSLYLE